MKPFERSCLYHKKFGMRVIEAHQEDEYKQLLDSGEWFDHPNKVLIDKKECSDEQPIRQHARKGSRNLQQPTEAA